MMSDRQLNLLFVVESVNHVFLFHLDAFDENVILVMGGKETGVNFESLAPFIKQKVKTLIPLAKDYKITS